MYIYLKKTTEIVIYLVMMFFISQIYMELFPILTAETENFNKEHFKIITFPINKPDLFFISTIAYYETNKNDKDIKLDVFLEKNVVYKQKSEENSFEAQIAEKKIEYVIVDLWEYGDDYFHNYKYKVLENKTIIPLKHKIKGIHFAFISIIFSILTISVIKKILNIKIKKKMS